jgi:hypothetical protein
MGKHTKKVLKLTAGKQRRVDYDKTISANRAKFRAGKVLTRSDIISIFNVAGVAPVMPKTGSYVRMHKENLKLMAVQAEVNNLLRSNGLYMKSSGYYTCFEICIRKDTKNTIIRYSAQADTNEVCEITLEAGYVSRTNSGTWGSYNRVYNNAGVKKAIVAVSPTREDNARNRVKMYK